VSTLAVSSGRTGTFTGNVTPTPFPEGRHLLSPRASSPDRESLPWEPCEMQDAPPLVCEVWREEVPDGKGVNYVDESEDEHFLCAECWRTF